MPIRIWHRPVASKKNPQRRRGGLLRVEWYCPDYREATSRVGGVPCNDHRRAKIRRRRIKVALKAPDRGVNRRTGSALLVPDGSAPAHRRVPRYGRAVAAQNYCPRKRRKRDRPDGCAADSRSSQTDSWAEAENPVIPAKTGIQHLDCAGFPLSRVWQIRGVSRCSGDPD